MTPAEFKNHRERIGWTQRQAAEGLRVTVAQVSAIENGRSNVTKTIGFLFSLYQLGDVPGKPSGAAKNETEADA